MSDDLHKKLLIAQGLLSQAQHRMTHAWNQSYSDLVDASNIMIVVEKEVKAINRNNKILAKKSGQRS